MSERPEHRPLQVPIADSSPTEEAVIEKNEDEITITRASYPDGGGGGAQPTSEGQPGGAGEIEYRFLRV